MILTMMPPIKTPGGPPFTVTIDSEGQGCK